jgi:hypothetical protein
MFLSTAVAAGRRSALAPRFHQRLGNLSRRQQQQQQQQQQFSSNKKGDLPPPLPSPSKAKQEYLKTMRKENTTTPTPTTSSANTKNINTNTNKTATTDDLFLKNPQAKIDQLTQELEAVRDRATAKLDAEINKSIWRKLTDPLRRYKHSMINIGAMCLAYMLAHMLFVKSKSEKEAKRLMEEAQANHQDLQTALQSLLEPTTLQEMAQACVSDIQPLLSNENATTTSYFPWRFLGATRSTSTSTELRTPRRGRQSTSQQQQQQQLLLVERLQDALEQQLAQRIGEKALTEEQRQRRSIQEVWEESQSQLKALNENPELLLLQAILEESAAEEETRETNNDSTTKNTNINTNTETETTPNKQPRRVFSM